MSCSCPSAERPEEHLERHRLTLDGHLYGKVEPVRVMLGAGAGAGEADHRELQRFAVRRGPVGQRREVDGDLDVLNLGQRRDHGLEQANRCHVPQLGMGSEPATRRTGLEELRDGPDDRFHRSQDGGLGRAVPLIA